MRNCERSIIRRFAPGLVALVLAMLPFCLTASGTRNENANPAVNVAAERQELESSRPASAGLVALGFGLALTAHRLKRRTS